MDEELRRGLKQLLDYQGDDVEDVFCLTFELAWTEMAEKQRVELKPDGANIISVTKANKEKFVLRYVRWVLVDSVKTQWDHFQTGVMRIMEDSSLRKS
jgi:ubiquitin-protein ligase E3 A/E3 ubiquitin-protein ligase HERC4